MSTGPLALSLFPILDVAVREIYSHVYDLLIILFIIVSHSLRTSICYKHSENEKKLSKNVSTLNEVYHVLGRAIKSNVVTVKWSTRKG